MLNYFVYFCFDSEVSFLFPSIKDWLQARPGTKIQLYLTRVLLFWLQLPKLELLFWLLDYFWILSKLYL